MNIKPQQKGSMGLHYICYRLAQQGWHVNTGQRGAMSPTEGECWRDKNKPITFQTRSQTDKRPIPLGTGAITKDLLIAVIGLGLNKPEVYIFTADEAIDANS